MQEKIQGNEEERGQSEGVWAEQRDKVLQTGNKRPTWCDISAETRVKLRNQTWEKLRKDNLCPGRENNAVMPIYFLFQVSIRSITMFQ